MSSLQGKRHLLPAASRGIGAAIARRFARGGAAVAIGYERSADAANAIAREIEAAGGRAVAIQMDAANPTSIKQAVDRSGLRARRPRYPCQQCRHHSLRNDRGSHPRGHRHDAGSQRAGGHCGDAGGPGSHVRGRPHHFDRQQPRRSRARRRQSSIFREQGRADRLDEGHRPRSRPARDHRQSGASRLDQYRHESGRRSLCRSPAAAHGDREIWPARGRGRALCLHRKPRSAFD